MDPALDAEVVPVTHGFDTFTKSWSGDDRERLKQVAMNSRDQFTRERNWTIDGFDIPLVRSDPSIKKRGGTEIIGYDEWRGVDTLELHGQRMLDGNYVPGARAVLHRKDARIISGLARRLGVVTPAFDVVADALESLVEEGGSDLDHSALEFEKFFLCHGCPQACSR